MNIEGEKDKGRGETSEVKFVCWCNRKERGDNEDLEKEEVMPIMIMMICG